MDTKLAFISIILFLPHILWANGPLFQHKDTFDQQEFDNVYQDLTTKISNSPAALLLPIKFKNSTTSVIVATFSTSGFSLLGTTTNDSAAAGSVGEFVRASVTSAVNSTGNGQWYDITSISLTAGDWDISGQIISTLNGATETVSLMAITATSGNSTSGQIDGDNRLPIVVPVASNDSSGTIAAYRQSIASTTTYYLKIRQDFSAGTPQAYGRISARRVR